MSTLFRPTYLKEIAARYGLTPSKAYGQNYLISPHPIEAMIDAGELSSKDTIIEVGPGFGVLTLALAPRVKKVIAFEIERKLEKYWEEKQRELGNVEVVWGNVLKEIGEKEYALPRKYKVLANLPYQITSPVLRLFLEASNKPERLVVMVQKEVALRICAKKGEMSLLAVSVQYYGEPKIVTKVGRGSFWPSPKVDSAVISITTLQHNNTTTQRQNEDSGYFFKVVKAGFAHPRKQVWRNLAEGLKLDKEFVQEVLQEVTGDEKVRAEEISVHEWREVVEKMRNLK